ncbi:hypothetical protein QYE76_066513 [Lolium multiflorum]|uniref:Transposase (putative) gypsy type domain-containing protein n=1 Tax=Lolium multiflorum TaxID=4521 RepID=A0AAD8W9Z4_LOLMU|nr:hypothetical protein QYE76_066513 [Lolium multiflorum]
MATATGPPRTRERVYGVEEMMAKLYAEVGLQGWAEATAHARVLARPGRCPCALWRATTGMGASGRAAFWPMSCLGELGPCMVMIVVARGSPPVAVEHDDDARGLPRMREWSGWMRGLLLDLKVAAPLSYGRRSLAGDDVPRRRSQSHGVGHATVAGGGWRRRRPDEGDGWVEEEAGRRWVEEEGEVEEEEEEEEAGRRWVEGEVEEEAGRRLVEEEEEADQRWWVGGGGEGGGHQRRSLGGGEEGGGEVELHQLTPNSILHISLFITLCECFLGTHPHWGLWKRIFYLRRNNSRSVVYNVGGACICVRPDVDYFDVKFPDSVQGWRKRLLYIKDESVGNQEYSIAPFDVVAEILIRRSWDAEASAKEKTATDALMKRIHQLQNTHGEELSGIQITAYFLRIRVPPLQARKNPLWMYAGEEDVDRISKDLSVKDLDKLTRHFSSLSKKEEFQTSCRVEPYSGSHALPEPLMDQFIRLGSQSIGFRNKADTLKVSLQQAEERAEALEAKLKLSKEAREKAEADAAVVADLRQRLANPENALSDKIFEQITREQGIIDRLESQNRRFLPGPFDASPATSHSRKTFVDDFVGDSSNADLLQELNELRQQLQSMKKQAVVVMDQSRKSSDRARAALQQAQEALKQKEDAAAEASRASQREDYMLDLMTSAGQDMSGSFVDIAAEDQRVNARVEILLQLAQQSGSDFWADVARTRRIVQFQDRASQVRDFLDSCTNILAMVYKPMFPQNPQPADLPQLMDKFKSVDQIHLFVKAQLVDGAKFALIVLKICYPKMSLDNIVDICHAKLRERKRNIDKINDKVTPTVEK